MKILIFGPNGSGKGTQGAVVKEKYRIPHIETGVIFRENISNDTDLGREAKDYIERGELVPDSITVPMILERLSREDCDNGWLLDGFPRNLAQAQALDGAMQEKGISIDAVIEIVLDRQTAKNRIMGRRLCAMDNNHPNNIFIDSIKPKGDRCRICGGRLKTRSDDQDEDAIDQRHDIYYDTEAGTLAAVGYFAERSKATGGLPRTISIDGQPGVREVSNELIRKLNEIW